MPAPAALPAAGLVLATVPDGWDDAVEPFSDQVYPAATSAASAASTDWPATSGTLPVAVVVGEGIPLVYCVPGCSHDVAPPYSLFTAVWIAFHTQCLATAA